MIESIIDMEADVRLVLQARRRRARLGVDADVGDAALVAIGIVPGGSRRSGCSFSQPRLTTITSPPKFGFRLMLRSVRIGTIASGASIATPQP